MSYCKSSGIQDKDRVIFLTEEDASKPSTVKLSEAQPADLPQGLITESGEINWECPCLGGMAVGPCGVEFREAFSCFHYSNAELKGSDCLEQFTAMQECMKEYPELYEKENEADVSIPIGDGDENGATSKNDKPAERMAVQRSSASSPANSPSKENVAERPSSPPSLSNSIPAEEITTEQPTISSVSTEICTNDSKDGDPHVQSTVSSEDSINHDKSPDSLVSVDQISPLSVNTESSNL